MEVQRTPVDNTPLVVNLLRLIRDARSPNYKDHEKGPVTFHFGGLCMRDTGGYAEAEELWRRVSTNYVEENRSSSSGGSRAVFRGPLYLAVYLNHSPVEVWTLQDFREPSTEHSVPRDFEQLEQLNTLVRVLFAHLRSQEIYGVVLQSCVTTADDSSVTQAEVSDGPAGSSPRSPMLRETPASSLRGLHSPQNRVSLRLFHTAEDCPHILTTAQRQFLWSSEDFVRVDVVMNKAWRYQTAPPVYTLPATGTTTTNPTAIVDTTLERSSPIKTTSSGVSRTQTNDSDAPSPSTSPEVTGSLAKSSLPTPHLAPTGTSPSFVNRPASVSPVTCISPLFTNQRKSPVPALSDFVLPPPEPSELFDNDVGRQSRSSPLGLHHASIFSSIVGCGGVAAGKSNATASSVPTAAVAAPQSTTTASAMGCLEDAMRLSDAMHVRRMGTLVSAGKEATVAPFTSPAQPQHGSLLAAASVGALSGLDSDSPLGWSGAELEDFNDDSGLALGEIDGAGGQKRHDSALSGSSPSDTATEQLMSLLGLCSSVKLHHVAPAPFGDLVIALNLKDSLA